MTCNRTSLNCHIAITLSITISKFEYSKTDCFWFTSLCVLAHVEIGTTMTTTKVQIITPQVSPLQWLFLAKHHQESPPHCLLLSLCSIEYWLWIPTRINDCCWPRCMWSLLLCCRGSHFLRVAVHQSISFSKVNVNWNFSKSYSKYWSPRTFVNTNVILFKCNFLGDSSSSQVCLQTPSPIGPP